MNERNKASLKTLHQYVRKDIKLKDFISNISAITIMSSNFIFNVRDHQEWDSPGYVGPLIKSRTRTAGRA